MRRFLASSQFLRAKPFILWGALTAIFLGNGGFRSLVGNWIEYRRLSREIEDLRRQETELSGRLKEAATPAAVERAARVEFGMARPGEVEYRFDPPPATTR